MIVQGKKKFSKRKGREECDQKMKKEKNQRTLAQHKKEEKQEFLLKRGFLANVDGKGEK